VSDAYQQLQIRNALIDNYNAYAEGLDSKNWPLVRACFLDEIYIDYGPISDPTGAASVPRRADDWLQLLQSVINRFDITRHTITNHRVTIDGDTISCRAYLIADHVKFDAATAPHVTDENVVTVVGEYNNYYRQEGGQWKICRSELVVNWSRGNIGLMA